MTSERDRELLSIISDGEPFSFYPSGDLPVGAPRMSCGRDWVGSCRGL